MILCTTTGTLVSLLQPWPLKIIIDHVLYGLPLSSKLANALSMLPGTSSPSSLLTWLAAASFGFYCVQSVLENAGIYLSARAGRALAHATGEHLFRTIQRRSLLFHARHTVGDSMSRIISDSWCVPGYTQEMIIGPLPAILTILAMLLIMRAMDPRLTVIAILAAPFMAGAVLLLGRRIRRAARARREVESRIQAHLQQTLSGISTVQAFGQEDRSNDQFVQHAAAAIRAQQENVLLRNVSSLWTGLISTIGTGLVLLVGGRHVLHHTLTIGTLLVFVSYLRTLQGQFDLLARSYTSLQSLRGKADRVLELFDEEPDLPEGRQALAANSVRGEVRFESVRFGYEPSRPVLESIDLHVLAGQTLAIVGPSGAGKTTLIGLLLRFFDPWSGTVRLDGVDIKDVRLRSLRQTIAVVLQDAFLFPVSIAENIACGRPNATQEQIEAAARAANAHEFIMKLPQDYGTVVGECGSTLSGGERQRISIARAFLKDAPVLILDEPTSAIDAESESQVMAGLRRLMHGRTTLIIAHRFSTVREADKIVVLQAGRIVDSGTHDELCSRRGIYASMLEAVGGVDRHTLFSEVVQ